MVLLEQQDQPLLSSSPNESSFPFSWINSIALFISSALRFGKRMWFKKRTQFGSLTDFLLTNNGVELQVWSVRMYCTTVLQTTLSDIETKKRLQWNLFLFELDFGYPTFNPRHLLLVNTDHMHDRQLDELNICNWHVLVSICYTLEDYLLLLVNNIQ